MGTNILHKLTKHALTSHRGKRYKGIGRYTWGHTSLWVNGVNMALTAWDRLSMYTLYGMTLSRANVLEVVNDKRLPFTFNIDKVKRVMMVLDLLHTYKRLRRTQYTSVYDKLKFITMRDNARYINSKK